HPRRLLSSSLLHARAPLLLFPSSPPRPSPDLDARDDRPPFHHWITSSARASTDGGMVRPSAFAVLRLMTSSNLVACSTGGSAGPDREGQPLKSPPSPTHRCRFCFLKKKNHTSA